MKLKYKHILKVQKDINKLLYIAGVDSGDVDVIIKDDNESVVPGLIMTFIFSVPLGKFYQRDSKFVNAFKEMKEWDFDISVDIHDGVFFVEIKASIKVDKYLIEEFEKA